MDKLEFFIGDIVEILNLNDLQLARVSENSSVRDLDASRFIGMRYYVKEEGKALLDWHMHTYLLTNWGHPKDNASWFYSTQLKLYSRPGKVEVL